jgi:hypothetical protein
VGHDFTANLSALLWTPPPPKDEQAAKAKARKRANARKRASRYAEDAPPALGYP